MAQDDDVEIWFLTGSQALYGEETLRQVEEQSRQITETLAGQVGGDGVCHRSASRRIRRSRCITSLPLFWPALPK